jgi:hypothetical protein
MLIRSLCCAAALLSSSIAAAGDKAASVPGEIRLSDAEKEKVLEAAAASNRPVPSVSAPVAAEEDGEPRQVHGEVGVSVGTGGYRSAYGTAIVPLRKEGVAIISVQSTDFGSRAPYIGPWWK